MDEKFKRITQLDQISQLVSYMFKRTQTQPQTTIPRLLSSEVLKYRMLISILYQIQREHQQGDQPTLHSHFRWNSQVRVQKGLTWDHSVARYHGLTWQNKLKCQLQCPHRLQQPLTRGGKTEVLPPLSE